MKLHNKLFSSMLVLSAILTIAKSAPVNAQGSNIYKFLVLLDIQSLPKYINTIKVTCNFSSATQGSWSGNNHSNSVMEKLLKVDKMEIPPGQYFSI